HSLIQPGYLLVGSLRSTAHLSAPGWPTNSPENIWKCGVHNSATINVIIIKYMTWNVLLQKDQKYTKVQSG
ncbi:MAG: hypothetical protein PVG60_10840, partial [Desulfarculaceae bacterium]